MLGGENRKFMLVVLLAFFVVLLGVSTSTLAFSVAAIDHNADTSIDLYRNLVKESIEGELYDFGRLLRNPNVNQTLYIGSGGDQQILAIVLFTMLEITLSSPYYLLLSKDGVVVDSKLPEEIGNDIPTDIDMDGTHIVGDFRGKSGDLVMIGAPLSDGFSAAVVVDITNEVEKARRPFANQKRSVVLVSILIFTGFLVFSVLVAVIVIARANSRFISGPIRELEAKANRLMEGDTNIDIEVNTESDYYALQALLDSMRRMLREAEKRGSDAGS